MFFIETAKERFALKTIYISQFIENTLIGYIKAPDRSLYLVHKSGRTYPAVDAHPDMFFCQMGISEHHTIFCGNPHEIGPAYPQNIKYNAVCLDGYFIHNLKYTSPALIKEVQKLGLTPVDVKQGYTKCSCVVVDGHSLITADSGIIKTLKKYPDIDVLPISQGFVKLEGFRYGFLGGASGRVEDEIIFNGDLSKHPDYEAICRFIRSRGLKVKYFPEYPLTDIGSILTDF